MESKELQVHHTRPLIEHRELAGTKEHVLEEAIESKYQVRLLFKLLGQMEIYKRLQGVCDDAWVMQQFTEMLHAPKYALIKTCPRGDNEDFPFHPLIYAGNIYTKQGSNVRVTNQYDNSMITTLKHPRDIICLIIGDGVIYTSTVSEDNTIVAWNILTFTFKILVGHTGAVYCLTVNDGKLYSGGGYGDHSIKVWDCNSHHDLITTLGVSSHDEHVHDGHTGAVRCLVAYNGKLYSGSADTTIKVWNCSTNKLITTLKEHVTTVTSLVVHGGKLYSKSYGDIKVWDCSDDSLITSLEHSCGVDLLQFHDDKLYTYSQHSIDDSERAIRVYDCSYNGLEATIRGAGDVKELTCQNGKLYSKNKEGHIMVWQL
jgi:WD40 repeat protein